MTTNFSLFTIGVAGISAAIELARSGQYISAAVVGVVGLVAVFLYEKLPPSTPA